MEEGNIKKVLLIDNSVQETGAYHSIRCFIKKLQPRISYYYAVPRGCWNKNKDIPPSRLENYQFNELSKSWRLIWYFPRLIINSIKIGERVRREAIQIVHVNDLYNMVGICVKLMVPKVKLVYHIRLRRTSYARPVFGLWIWLINKFSDVIVPVSETVERDMLMPSEKVVRIYDAVEGSRINSNRHKPFDANHISFLYIGNYIPGKGQDHALRAFEVALRSCKNISLQLVGVTGGIAKNEAYLLSLKQFIIDHELNDSIHIHDQGSDVCDLIMSCDVVLNFSESESFSLVCLEALANGKPVIATKCGGPQEIIRHLENGILVKNKDVLAMSQAIMRLAVEPALITKLSNETQVDFEKKFNPNLLANKLLAVYNQDLAC
jgi:glycosyltransferase involved in cell wall biosynthesis